MANILIVEDDKNMRDIIYEHMHMGGNIIWEIVPSFGFFAQ